jgi:cell division protein FtsZ
MDSGVTMADQETAEAFRKDVLVVACGGSGRRVFAEAEDVLGVPVLFINTNDSSTIPLAPSGMEGCYGDPELASAIAFENMGAIKEAFQGYKAVVVFSIFGGGTGTGMVPVVLRCARECGCRTISVIGIPLSFEASRRRLAQGALGKVSETSDRMYVLDEDSVVRMCPDVRVNSTFKMIAHSIIFTVKCIADLLTGPFFSTFFDKVYTFAYVSEINPVKAVEKAITASGDESPGGIVVAVSSDLGEAESDAIYDKVAEMTGTVPDIVRRNDREGTKMVVFFSVWSA